MVLIINQFVIISIHALREEGDRSNRNIRRVCLRISIHALREEGDGGERRNKFCVVISIHALREEGDQCFHISARRWGNFYPRPPRGGRPCRQLPENTPVIFLSTPSARRATGPPSMLLSKALFLSTPSARRATG